MRLARRVFEIFERMEIKGLILKCVRSWSAATRLTPAESIGLPCLSTPQTQLIRPPHNLSIALLGLLRAQTNRQGTCLIMS